MLGGAWPKLYLFFLGRQILDRAGCPCKTGGPRFEGAGIWLLELEVMCCMLQLRTRALFHVKILIIGRYLLSTTPLHSVMNGPVVMLPTDTDFRRLNGRRLRTSPYVVDVR